MAEGQSTNRVIEVDRDNLDAEQQRVLARLESGRGKILTPYKIWIHCAEVADGMEVLGTYLNTTDTLTDAEREIAILMTAVYWKSPFVIAAHARHSRKAGMDEAAVTAMLAGQPAVFSDARQQVVHDLVADALAGGAIADEAFDRYEAVLGRAGLSQFLSLIGYYTSVSLAMRMHGVLPAGH
jgi:4-carboxymuconolactone decarboxylase